MKKNNRGMALFASLTVMFLLSVTIIVILLTAYNYVTVSETGIKRLNAIALAESGIHYAYWKIRINDAAFLVAATSGEGYEIAELKVTIKLTGWPLPAPYTIKSTVSY